MLLLDQNRARWDQLLIRRGLAALQRAEAQAGTIGLPLGSYTLQADIAACHARAGSWRCLAPSPIVDLNRAVALAFAVGPAAGLELVDALTSDPSLKNYHSCRAHCSALGHWSMWAISAARSIANLYFLPYGLARSRLGQDRIFGL